MKDWYFFFFFEEDDRHLDPKYRDIRHWVSVLILAYPEALNFDIE